MVLYRSTIIHYLYLLLSPPMLRQPTRTSLTSLLSLSIRKVIHSRHNLTVLKHSADWTRTNVLRFRTVVLERARLCLLHLKHSCHLIHSSQQS